jgi:hypothetical protein
VTLQVRENARTPGVRSESARLPVVVIRCANQVDLARLDRYGSWPPVMSGYFLAELLEFEYVNTEAELAILTLAKDAILAFARLSQAHVR